MKTATIEFVSKRCKRAFEECFAAWGPLEWSAHPVELSKGLIPVDPIAFYLETSDPKAVGRFLARHVGAVASGYRLGCREGTRGNAHRWHLTPTDAPPTPVAPDWRPPKAEGDFAALWIAENEGRPLAAEEAWQRIREGRAVALKAFLEERTRGKDKLRAMRGLLERCVKCSLLGRGRVRRAVDRKDGRSRSYVWTAYGKPKK